MNREDVIRMARESRIEQDGEMLYSFRNSDQDQDVHISDLERFAALVAAAKEQEMLQQIRHIIVQAEERGAAAEREACAKVCENIEALSEGSDDPPPYIYYEAIRARGETTLRGQA